MDKLTTGFTTLSLAQKAGMDIIQEAKDEVLVKEQMNIAKADEHINQKGKAFMNEAIMDKDPFVKKYLIMRTRDEEGYEDGLRRNLDDALHDLGLPCQRDRRVAGSLFQDTATRCLLLACTLKGMYAAPVCRLCWAYSAQALYTAAVHIRSLDELQRKVGYKQWTGMIARLVG